jgi:hypothetical protein
MGQRIKAEELREILSVARKMREAASASQQPDYVSLFLRAALALEERAQALAYHSGNSVLKDETDDEAAQTDVRHHIDFRC